MVEIIFDIEIKLEVPGKPVEGGRLICYNTGL